MVNQSRIRNVRIQKLMYPPNEILLRPLFGQHRSHGHCHRHIIVWYTRNIIPPWISKEHAKSAKTCLQSRLNDDFGGMHPRRRGSSGAWARRSWCLSNWLRLPHPRVLVFVCMLLHCFALVWLSFCISPTNYWHFWAHELPKLEHCNYLPLIDIKFGQLMALSIA